MLKVYFFATPRKSKKSVIPDGEESKLILFNKKLPSKQETKSYIYIYTASLYILGSIKTEK
jgi:hypothetical protein